MLPELAVHRTCMVAGVRNEVEVAKTQAAMNETDLGRAPGKDDVRFSEAASTLPSCDSSSTK